MFAVAVAFASALFTAPNTTVTLYGVLTNGFDDVSRLSADLCTCPGLTVCALGLEAVA